MYSLLLSICLLFYAVCDFFNLSPFKHMLQALPPDEKVRRKYRILRGIGFLGLAVVAGGTFTAEIVYRIRFTWIEALYYIALPYAVPLLYIVFLGLVFKVYKLPWDIKRRKDGKSSHGDL